MPKVGDKEFPYTEEGMAAAEAEAAAMEQPAMDEAAMLEQLLNELPTEVPDEEGALEEAMAEAEPEAEMELPEDMPEEETVMQIFEEVFGNAFDDSSPEDIQKLEFILMELASDPELVAGLSSGEISISEFAIQLYRKMSGEGEAEPAQATAEEPMPMG
jgi:hypothetical protein|tara:strand:+ start:2193 stop:2669 length:477 start_codon:yes stop_codon:yes gene_type:complete